MERNIPRRNTEDPLKRSSQKELTEKCGFLREVQSVIGETNEKDAAVYLNFTGVVSRACKAGILSLIKYASADSKPPKTEKIENIIAEMVILNIILDERENVHYHPAPVYKMGYVEHTYRNTLCETDDYNGIIRSIARKEPIKAAAQKLRQDRAEAEALLIGDSLREITEQIKQELGFSIVLNRFRPTTAVEDPAITAFKEKVTRLREQCAFFNRLSTLPEDDTPTGRLTRDCKTILSSMAGYAVTNDAARLPFLLKDERLARALAETVLLDAVLSERENVEAPDARKLESFLARAEKDDPFLDGLLTELSEQPFIQAVSSFMENSPEKTKTVLTEDGIGKLSRSMTEYLTASL